MTAILLKDALECTGTTLRELGASTGIHYSTICELQRGDRTFRKDWVPKLKKDLRARCDTRIAELERVRGELG